MHLGTPLAPITFRPFAGPSDYPAMVACANASFVAISVGEPWRRRGLARALISHSLRAQAAAGMTESGLGVESQNASGANRVYEDCGFVVDRRNCAYRKVLVV